MIWLYLICGVAGVGWGSAIWWHTVGFRFFTGAEGTGGNADG